MLNILYLKVIFKLKMTTKTQNNTCSSTFISILV